MPITNTSSLAILIVDDAAALRAALRTIFISEGYRVVGDLGHGAGVLEAIGKLKPDIVCLDYQLPDINGVELLKTIHAEHPAVAVMMITGDAASELEAEAAAAGAVGFVRKPFSPDKIMREIHQVSQVLTLHRQQGNTEELSVKEPRASAVVVDDSATMRALLSSILRQAHVDVVGEAADGKSAIETVASCKPDIVCLDMDMPVMNGLEALKQIKRDNPDTKVLMITGTAGREAVLKAAQHGARGYILKPFAPDKVIEAIDKLLAG
ncbi:MAG: response regulator [Gammaproteobacteria bacterium]|nr:response regulator [Rhodocyclaceae bacterium]MBU3907637.1 response regulator [Gammaproteobacteria bacterium]MBU3990875.1 response regulator [Gammaproteobacteria bacterium]MBU4004283.1 response regulator [Gammaproteobacteria bacterium]MBU4019692.1 response regulator [Gammaproteobacteria bacterium]